MSSENSSLSVVIPVYNSAEILPLLVERLEPVLKNLTSAYELILVNDGSQDNSGQVISGLAQAHAWIHSIDLMRNYGQHNALLCGIRAAQHDITITMDDDLQHPPEELPTLLANLTQDVDVVYGTPEHEPHGLLRNLASQLTKLALQNAMGVDVARQVSALRVFRTQVRDAFMHYSGNYVSIDVLLNWGTTRFKAVQIDHRERAYGQSNYTFGKLFTHALNMITGFNTLPLQFASILGFVFTLFGAGVLVYVIGRYLINGQVVPGFAFQSSIIAIFSGVQLFTLGIIGEYLARMHFRIMDRPTYTVRTRSSKKANSSDE